MRKWHEWPKPYFEILDLFAAGRAEPLVFKDLDRIAADGQRRDFYRFLTNLTSDPTTPTHYALLSGQISIGVRGDGTSKVSLIFSRRILTSAHIRAALREEQAH